MFRVVADVVLEHKVAKLSRQRSILSERAAGPCSLHPLPLRVHGFVKPLYSRNCSIDGIDVTAELDTLGMPVPVWLNFSNCTFVSGTDYMRLECSQSLHCVNTRAQQ